MTTTQWSRWMGMGFVVFTALAGSTGCDKLSSNKSDSSSKKSDKHAKDDDDSSDDDSDSKGKGERKKPVKESAPSSAPQPTASAASPVITPPATPDTATPQPTGGRSAVPTQEEWRAVTREVTVPGSGTLNCETKMLREWLRISCRDKNPTGGTPTGVSVTSGGGHGDDFAFASGGIASLVVRFVEGVSIDAVFTWTDDSHVLHIVWPRGAPEPNEKGVFEMGNTAPRGAGGRQVCHANTQCPKDYFCMPDNTCHPAAEVQ